MRRHPLVLNRPMTITGDDRDQYVASLEDHAPFADDVLDVAQHLVRPDDVVLDVGANVGIHAVALARLTPDGFVHAFEPSPTTAGYCALNVDENGARNVEVHRVAVGAAEGELQFFHNTDFAAGSLALDLSSDLIRDSVADKAVGDRGITVPVTTVDRFVETSALDRLDLLKIDTEGHDLAVLEGAQATLLRFRPAVIIEFATYALTMHAQLLPHEALRRIRSAFDRVFVITATGLREIVDDSDAIGLLYENATAAPVQDLLGIFAGSRAAQDVAALPRSTEAAGRSESEWLRQRVLTLQAEVETLRSGLAPDLATTRDVQRTTAAAGDREHALVAELEALRRTVSWRVTRPLRAVRRRLPGR